MCPGISASAWQSFLYLQSDFERKTELFVGLLCAEGAIGDSLFPVNSVELGLCNLADGTLLQLMMGQDNDSRSSIVICM